MKIQYIGLDEINGPLVYLKTPENISFDEQVKLVLENGEVRIGNVIMLNEDITVIQVYQGTNEMNLKGVKVELEGKPLQIKLSKEMLGRVFNGSGKPIDGLGEIESNISRNISGKAINPIARQYPRNFIETGISAIDCLMTLIRGQKLPIFSGSGINHNDLTERIIRQANIKDDENFAVVFGLMGAEYETAEFFRKSFEENAMIKAEAISKMTGEIVLADDSGLEIDYLNKEPGIYSARYMGEDTSYHIKNANLIQRLEDVPDEKRTARFVCAIAAVFPDGRRKTVRAAMEGRIGYEEKGENGFGYDPIFYLPEYGCTSAELSMEEKNRISHRGKALCLIKEELV